MGHLINPIAFRMGWSQNWVDLFFVDEKYYPQYLHMLFRIRLVITGIFRDYWFERQGGFFFSHLLLSKDYTGLNLKIYFYDGKTEAFIFKIEEYVQEDRDYLFAEDLHEEKKSNTFYSFYIYFIFFRLFNTFYITSQWFSLLSRHHRIERIAEAFFIYDKRLMHSALQLRERRPLFWSREEPGPNYDTFYSLAYCKTTTIRFFWFYLLCKELASMHDKTDVRMGLRHKDVLQQLTFIYTMVLRNKFIFTNVRPYLLALTNYLAKDYQGIAMDIVSINFMIITNENITAAFIARYIAVKLEQGFTTRDLMNPLRREFRRLMVMDKRIQKRSNAPFRYLAHQYANRNYFSSLFHTMMKQLALFYAKSNAALLFSQKTYLNLDGFIFLYHLVDKLKARFEDSKVLRSIFSLSDKYARYYFFFAFFNYNKLEPYYRQLIECLFLIPKELKFHSKLGLKLNLGKFPLILPKLLFNDFENHSDWAGKQWISYNYSLLLIFLHSFKKKMHLLYSHQNYYYLAKAVLAKNRLLRLYTPNNSEGVRFGFRGFKIQCLGRFTRRQRSAKLTWTRGSVPLNTMSAFIDYGSFDVVLKNSSINVKVWFHKDKGFSEYYMKLL